MQASPFFDRLVFSKVAARLGGKVKAIVNGGAPLSTHVEEFLRASMCCPVVQVGGQRWYLCVGYLQGTEGLMLVWEGTEL